MQISDEGIRLIKSFEGYLTRQKDGSCAAYLCPAGVPTIGWGCTEGVKLGMVWTEAEAEAALRRELDKAAKIVAKHVKVATNQNENDALIALTYNIGEGGGRDKTGRIVPGFSTSTVLKRLNKGDRAGAAQAFEYWNKGGGRVLKGLVSRRKREAALFLKPVEAPAEPAMPQAVEEVKPVSKPAIAAVSATVVTAATQAAPVIAPSLPVPAVPEVVTQSISNVESWKGMGSSLWTLKSWALTQPTQAAILLLVVGAIWFGPRLLQKN